MMKAGGFCVEADVDNGNTMNKKVRNAQLAQFNFIFGERINLTAYMIGNNSKMF